MKVGDIFSYAFGAIRLRKLRAGLTTLGVVIGIAAIVALLSISQGLQIAITDQLQSGFATDTLIVSTGGGFGIIPGSRASQAASSSDFPIYVNDTQRIDELPNVVVSAAIIQQTGNIRSQNNKEAAVTLVGVDFSKYARIYSATFIAESGVIPLNPENEMIVIGKRISDPWENGTLFTKINEEVEIIWLKTTRPPENVSYRGSVEAVLKEVGGFSLTGPSDSSVYIPISQAQSFFGTDVCDRIIVKLDNDDDATIENVSKAIKELFGDKVSVTSSTAVLGIVSNVFSTVEIFLAGIAAISLLVAGIGIMNIMIVSLMERTREIGILKALGMKSRTVLAIFLSEAVVVGLIGAVFGIVLGWLLANVASRVFTGGSFVPVGPQVGSSLVITPVLTPIVLVGAFAFGVVISVLFAIYPAWRASKLKPVEALRYE